MRNPLCLVGGTASPPPVSAREDAGPATPIAIWLHQTISPPETSIPPHNAFDRVSLCLSTFTSQPSTFPMRPTIIYLPWFRVSENQGQTPGGQQAATVHEAEER